MAAECVPGGPDLKEMGEEELWELINDNRHRISLGVRPCILIPYLRQARVLTEMDEDEILSCHNLTNRSMRTSYMLDLLRTQGRNGAVALLESLMIHYPTLYTQATGHKPSTEPSRFSGLIKYSELTEYLVRAVTGMQKELQEARCEASRAGARAASLEAELRQVVGQEEKCRRLQSENERVRRHLTSAHKEVTRLKDEKCDLYMRYTAAVEEKSALNMRLHDLNLQVYQLQTDLQKAQIQNEFQQRHSLRCGPPAEAQLEEEVRSLRCQLVKVEKLDPARQDILAQDLAEAVDSQVELAEQLRCSREDNEKLLAEKHALLEEKENLTLEVQQLTQDCNLQQQKNTVIQAQMRELLAERDQAYLSRDEAQAMIARVLAEKDGLRSQLMELQERLFSARTRGGAEEQRRSFEDADLDWQRLSSSSEEAQGPGRRRLCRMDALNPLTASLCMSECEDVAMSSIRSRKVEPPGPESLRRREEAGCADSSVEAEESDCLMDDFVFLHNVETDDKQRPKLSCSRSPRTECLSRPAAPPFLMRSRAKAIRVNGRVLTISFQGEKLLGQLTLVGGNKTGVFVHQVTEGSPAHTVGISPGAQVVEVKYEQNQKSLRMMLEDSTLEEAMWALGQVTGLCHLSVRPRQADYEVLLQQLQNNEASSGDSFYVRVNMSLAAGSSGSLAVFCNDILHVTNTQPPGAEDSWHASQVHPCQLLDLQSGTVPNYYRAQRLLIQALENMSFQTKKPQKGFQEEAQNKQKAVRIVSTGRPGRNPLWVSVENEKSKSADPGDAATAKSCVSLMPYTLVTPHYPPVCRPVLLLPTVLGRVLDKKLAGWQGFQLCTPEVLSPSEHAAQLQRAEILEEFEQGSSHCYTLKSVENVMKKGIHCVLPLGLDCVRRLHRAKVFPIIIFVSQSARSARKLRSKLQRQARSEEQLLTCSQNEEPLLDKLPCLYRSVDPDSWCDQNSLLTRLRTTIWEEQRRIVWVEPDLW
eukprot:XP_011615569.1 PREDICTED: caspase recruitment domain-containing protein 14 [Takifugu rubripes]